MSDDTLDRDLEAWAALVRMEGLDPDDDDVPLPDDLAERVDRRLREERKRTGICQDCGDQAPEVCDCDKDHGHGCCTCDEEINSEDLPGLVWLVCNDPDVENQDEGRA